MSNAGQNLASCCAELYALPIVEYLLGKSFHPGGAKLTRELARVTLVSPNSSVLDIACGNGTSARVIAADHGAMVTGCDYSAINLQRAEELARSAGLDGKIRYVRGDAMQLPFAPASFDVTLCECSLCLFDTMDGALRQLHRVLKPGGRIGISDFFLNAPVPYNLDNLLGHILCIATAPSAEGYRQALERAGFEHIRIREVNWTLADMIQRVRRQFKMLATANSAASTLLDLDIDDPAALLSDLEDFIASNGAGYLIATARRS